MELAPGLTVLTGETGAGKTMILTGLSLLCGARADSTLVRHGAQTAVVEGLLELPPGHAALERAAEAGADTEESLVLVRSLSSQGRSRAHVGGRAAPAGVLTEIAEQVIAIHGQADQWRLRRPEEHRDLLDGFGGSALWSIRSELADTYAAHREAVAHLSSLRAAAQERAREAELLRLGLEQIEAVDPTPGEDDRLRAEDERGSHAEELRWAAATARAALSGADEVAPGDEAHVLAALAQARSALEQVASADPDLSALAGRVKELGYLAADLAADLGSYLDQVDVDPARLAAIQSRRAELAALTRAYGPSVDEVLQWSAQAAARLADLDSTSDQIDAGQARCDELAARLGQLARELTSAREKTATALTEAITAEIAQLDMSGSRVEVAVDPAGSIGPAGADIIEIRLASGAGPARSVTRAASGGELSRVMLAIEVATAAESGRTPTFVFDEVDAGVGGRAAIAVGARLAELAQHAQVVVVTHLAQVAAFADRHLVIERTETGSVVSSGVSVVTGEDRLRELARMLGGSDGEVAREHARDLLARASARGAGDSRSP